MASECALCHVRKITEPPCCVTAFFWTGYTGQLVPSFMKGMVKSMSSFRWEVMVRSAIAKSATAGFKCKQFIMTHPVYQHSVKQIVELCSIITLKEGGEGVEEGKKRYLKNKAA